MSYGTLYLCATPIGNLQDITLRVLDTLKTVDLVACEDTRKTLQLLNHFSISKPVTSYYEHNKMTKGDVIIQQLKEGKNIALVSDAGMPGISDPGYDLVQQCLAEGITFTVLPGAVAAITGLVLSGLPTDRFAFEGFIPRQKKERQQFFLNLLHEERTMIFYEAPHKLMNTLEDMAQVFGADRPISFCRELTKLHEQVMRTTLGEAITYYTENPPKGEFVLVVAGAPEEAKELPSVTDAAARVKQLVEQGLSRKDAIKQTAQELNLPKNAVYAAALGEEE